MMIFIASFIYLYILYIGDLHLFYSVSFLIDGTRRIQTDRGRTTDRQRTTTATTTGHDGTDDHVALPHGRAHRSGTSALRRAEAPRASKPTYKYHILMLASNEFEKYIPKAHIYIYISMYLENQYFQRFKFEMISVL